ncbi:MAG: alpha/beta hydrolase [Anaerolineales bacterium]
MNKWLKIFSGLLLALALAGGGVVANVSREQAIRLTHTTPDRPFPRQVPADFGLQAEDVTLTTSDGVRLAAWYVPSQHGAVVMAQHGYKSTREEMLNEAQMLARHGYGVLITEARAHGYSQGDTITFGLKEVLDVRAGLDYLLTRTDADPNRIGVLGNSQGAVTLLLAAAQYPEIKAYVGNSPYAALQDEVATGVRAFTGLPPFPFAPLIQYFAEREAGFQATEVAPINHIAQVAPRPVFLMQGGQDTIIPTDSGQRLYEAAHDPKELWFDPNLGHTQFDTKQPGEYEQRVVAFFDEYLLGQ